ncbi:MAG: NUDIX domain-containing protein, partial [Oscillospiraceae bacterium]|nr:NUDIX domain-containing protein [Oscillospiraceae bacterium]
MEYIDLYSRDGSLLRRHVPRDEKRAPGECYRHVHVLLFDRAGNCLLQLRSIKKKFFPGEWGVTGGGVQSGETSREAGVRE